jgi:putative SOS response-associated peptidase YedK
MCGRFALFASGDELAERFRLAETPLFEPRYNIAPPIPLMRQSTATNRGRDASRLSPSPIPAR